jgi:hypothetical protein
MTGTEVGFETQAQRIADRGRDALVERLRCAYGDAAAAHADLISLDDEHIERMVQAAFERADGLQWRRALAEVAAAELGVSTREALSHPALARAQTLAGAPSYEQSLAEMIARPVPPPVAAPTGETLVDAESADDGAGPFEPRSVAAADSELPATVEHHAVEIAKTWPSGETAAAAADTAAAEDGAPAGEGAADELETVEADDVMLELLPEPDPIEHETEPYDVEAGFSEEQAPADAETGSAGEVEAAAEVGPATAEDAEDLAVEFPAIHLGGVANLPTKREGLSVRLSADGLDILHGGGDIIGRLIWGEIEALEVPPLRVRRRHKQLRARLVVRTPHGDASFEVPEVSGEELRDRVEPLMRLYGHS